ncbi:uncharacterized protein LOC128221815 [Mya arenaria]|uniref:uncharacterized protein LOC128221815 n=1 Tax=Mya arenaria TaxID=6604 RepID=UPI0022E72C58|nr:uncharacterized protein LOC128221815 [Mya arenaria]XP_052786389.1 uncharacterized protein LOC128221815 [Mya arenaria]XP_052786392.1 uncharacterized protein LOC128221815 [Mya arenaria]
MARRRLESALEAGQTIDQGKSYPSRFTKVNVDFDIKLEPEVDGVFSLQYSFDGRLLAVGCGNGTIRLYNTAKGTKLPDLRKTRYGGYPIMCLRFHPKNPKILFAGTSEGQILSCDISDFITEDGKIVEDFTNIQVEKDERWHEVLQEKKDSMKNEINCLDFDYTLQRYATAGRDLSIRIYDANTNQLVSEYTGYDNTKDPTNQSTAGAGMRVFSLKWHPEYDDIFLTGGWDKHIKIWDARNNEGIRRTIHGPHLAGDSLDLKGNKILTGSWEGRTDALEIWNYSTDYTTDRKKRPQVVNFPAGAKGPFLYAAQFCDNDVVVAGGSGTNSAMAINAETNEVIGEVKFNHPVQAIDTVHGGRLFAVGAGAEHGNKRLSGETGLKLCRLTDH